MLSSRNVKLRVFTQDDVAKQRQFFENAELAGLDCHYPHQYLKIDVENLFDLAGENHDNASFAIEVEGEYVGYAGLKNVRSPRGNFELGINIGNPDFWAKGFGSEAVSLLLKYGFYFLPGRRIELTVQERNIRAITCYSGCGFVEEGRLRKSIWVEGEYIDLVLMSILRPEWEALS